MFIVVLILFPAILAESDNSTTAELVSTDCDMRCGCDSNYVFNSDEEKCTYILQNLTERVVIYNPDHDIISDSRLARSIFIKGEHIFKGIMFSVVLFAACACTCVVAACIYCCRINYTDRELYSEVKTLAKQSKTDYKPKKSVSRPTQLQPIKENCNVVVADADVFVV